ncbi:DUF3857 domain-containing protein [Archangium lipolyticum]|uniref:DUF3857 domain-containing protein n=1 Tax=Archangium lipolyticum TaxID=2970465 RepID=UPI00214A2E13|nr:DUF3857 domain-containing protein [Archangium lipolyticum]
MRSFALCLGLLSLSLSALGAERGGPPPWEGPAFEASAAVMSRAAAALPAPEPREADVEVLVEEGRYEEIGPNRWRTTTHRVFRILNEAGIQTWAETRADWSPWRQSRPKIRARVISPQGQEHWLDPQTLHEATVEDSTPNLYTDQRLLRAPLPALRVGSLVEEESVVEDTQAFFEAGIIEHFYFANTVPVRKVRLLIDAEPSTQLSLRVRGLPLEPVPQHQGSRKRLFFEGGPYAPVTPLEANVPPSEAFHPHVAFSTGRSWSEVASTYHRIVESKLAGQSLQTQARSLTKGLNPKDRRAVAQRLLEWVQGSVRYTGLEFGASAVVPTSPQDTLARQFGDCKDLSTLMVGLLRASGLPAHVALVRSGREDVPELPGMGFFNHAIVYVPGTPALWIDPTDPAAEVGGPVAGLEGRHALVAAPDTQGLTLIDEAPPADNAAVFTRSILLAEEGPARVLETRELRGALAGDYRRLLRAMRPADFRRNMEALAAAQYQGSLAGLKYSPLEERTGPFRLDLDVSSARFATTGWREARVPLRIDSPLTWLPEVLDDVSDLLPDELGRKPVSAARRKSDLVLPVAYKAEVRYRVRPPPGFSVRTLPRDETIRLGPAVLSLRYSRDEEGGLAADFSFETVKRRYSADEVNAFRDALAKLARREPLVVELEDRGQRLVENGRVRDGLALYEKLLSRAPGSGLVRARYAGSLLGLGFGEQARAEARRAVEQRPESPLVHHVLAWVLQHDLQGRLRHEGADLEGAVAACRKALALEPENVAARALLAELLEYNPRGERFGQGAPLADALSSWRHLRDSVADRDVEDRYLLALFHSGAAQEALETAQAARSSTLRDQVLIMTLAELKGTREAITEAERSLDGLEARRNALSMAGGHLLTKRRYPEAAQLFEAALRGAYDPDLETRLELTRKVRRAEDSKADAGPEGLVRRVVLAAWTERSAQDFEKAVRPLLSKRDRADSDLRQTLRALHARASRYVRLANLDAAGVAAMADLAVAALDLQVDGKEKVGYRVGLRLPLGGIPADTWFVVREEKEYRLLATSSDPRPLGAEALRWFDANHATEGVLWLQWGMESAQDLPTEGLGPLGSFFATLRGFSGMEAVSDLRRAAAYLGASTGEPRVIKTLEADARYATGELRQRLQLALAVAYEASGNIPTANIWLDEVRREVPASLEAFLLKRSLLAAEGKWQGMREVAESRLNFLHQDPQGMRALLEAVVQLGDWKAVDQTGQQLMRLGTASAETYRTLAWAELLRGRASSEAVDEAQRAVSLTEREDPEALAVLAALLVETGRLEEARKLVDEALAQGSSDTVEGGVLYVRGRLAEVYGMTEAARALYRSVSAPEEPDARSFQKLAQARLTRVKEGGAPARKEKKAESRKLGRRSR